MNYVLDLHTHTLVSGHAYSTINDMAQAAAESGLSLLGITEHGPEMPGTCHEFYFHNLRVVPREKFGVELLFGVELNILDPDGTVDLDEMWRKELDVCIASLHPPCMVPGSRKENTNALIHAMEQRSVHVIGHPDDARYELDYPELVCASKANRVLLELNNASLNPKGFRNNSAELDKQLLVLCAEQDVPIIIGSDAHVDADVGRHDFADTLLKEVHFPEELIINRSVEKLKKYLL